MVPPKAQALPWMPTEAHIQSSIDTHDSKDGDVEEQEGGNELSNSSSVEGPGGELTWFKQRGWWWLLVVLVRLCEGPYGLPF
ncbi:hypothetical protein ACFX13_038886 [Malus domestica]